MKSSLNYPIALILIIVFAGYLLYTGYFEKPQVNINAYQKLCSRYLQAPAGEYSHDQIQNLIYKINYLFPAPEEKLIEAPERQLKHCANQLAGKLNDTK